MGWLRRAIVSTTAAVALAACGNLVDVGAIPVDGIGDGGLPESAALDGNVAQLPPDSGVEASADAAPSDASDASDACVPELAKEVCNGKCGKVKNRCGTLVDCTLCSPPKVCSVTNACVDPACVAEPEVLTCQAGTKCGTFKNSCQDNVVCSCNSTSGCVGGTCVVCEEESATCAGVACGDRVSNCGRTVTCPNTCFNGTVCLAGGNTCCTRSTECPTNRCKGPDGCGGVVMCSCGGAASCVGVVCMCGGGPCL